jgi:hypothetical protein
METARARHSDETAANFGPGVHSVPGGTVSFPSRTTVYLAGGAVLKANVSFTDAEGSGLRGRGVIAGGC